MFAIADSVSLDTVAAYTTAGAIALYATVLHIGLKRLRR